MKQKMDRPSSGKLRGLFCLGLAAVLAAGIALNSVAANTEFVQYDILVQSSPTHTVALSEGRLYAWGTNEQGQFPGSDLTESLEPVQLQRSIADVAVSSNRTLTVTTSGYLYSYGVEPATDRASSKKGTLLAKDAAQAAASETFAAYVSKTGALYTWGLNTYGQLGNGGAETSETPVQIFESGVKKVSLGNSFGLALMDDGSVYGWGANDALQIGYEPADGQPAEVVSSPVKIADDVQDISAGYYHSCLLKNDGSLWTCGDNQFSQTGAGGEYVVNGLTKVLDGVRSVSAGSMHNLAVATDGAVYAWGYGVFGQLGSGDSQRIDTPTEIHSDYVQVFAGVDNAFGVSSDGSVYSFGNNGHYRLAKTDGTNSLVAMRILDKDMNWVYEESLVGDDGHQHGVGSPDDAAAPDPSDVPVESGEPEIVSTPFVSGYDDGTFLPTRNVTRAEFVRMLVSVLCDDFDPTKDYGTCSFSDIPLGKWYEKYIAYAETKGLVHGYDDGTFRPDRPITRAEACVMVSQMFDGIPEEAPDAGFTDLDPNSAATAHINYLAASGIVNGDGNGTFRPKANITRAESVTLVAAAVGYKPGADEIEGLAEQFPESPFKDVPTSTWYYAYMLRAVGYVE